MQTQMTDSEARSVPRRRILLVGAEHSIQGLISTFLLTMGWTCAVVKNKEEMCTILPQKVFDAVVIDLGPTVAEAEKAICWMAQIRPSLVSRTLVLNSHGTDRQMRELIKRHDVIQLSHSCRGVPNEHIARIVLALIRVLIVSHPVSAGQKQREKPSKRARLCA